jgi:hypothetical protein
VTFRRATAAFAAVAALAVSTFLVPAAQAAACADGVTVVVDYRELGAGVQTGCASGSPASGLAALSGAGFGYTFPTRQPGFVCRINELPGTDREACVSTPPAKAYWSYWHAQPGGSWSYSSLGAGSYEPPAGSVEGWAFGAGEQPGISPPQRPAPPPQQPQPQPPPVAPPPPPPGQPQPTTTTTAAPETSATTTTSAESTTSATSSSSAPPVEAKPPTSVEPEGSSLGLIIAIVVIAVLGGVALWTARRRARARE